MFHFTPSPPFEVIVTPLKTLVVLCCSWWPLLATSGPLLSLVAYWLLMVEPSNPYRPPSEVLCFPN
jgi:hypothetical protein